MKFKPQVQKDDPRFNKSWKPCWFQKWDKSVLYQKICLQDHTFSTVQGLQPAQVFPFQVLENCKSISKKRETKRRTAKEHSKQTSPRKQQLSPFSLLLSKLESGRKEEQQTQHHSKISRTISAKTSVPLERRGLQNQMQNNLDIQKTEYPTLA